MNSSNLITIYYQNVRGIRSKSNELYLNLLNNNNYKIVALTETNLQPHISSSEFFPSHYNVFRKDRNLEACGKLGGGGVLLALSNELSSQRVDALEIDVPGCDCVWVKVTNISRDLILYICVVYIRPRTPLAVYQTFYDSLGKQNFKRNHKIIILGDFNLQIYGMFSDLNSGDIINKELLLFMNINNLFLKNNIRNFQGKTLDLIISDMDSVSVNECDEPLVRVDPYHPALEAEVDTGAPLSYRSRSESNQRMGFCYRRADFLQLYVRLSELNWNNLYLETDINKAVDIFYQCIFNVVKQVCPLKKQYNISKYPFWFPVHVRKNIRLKEKFHRKYKKYGLREDYQNFKTLRSSVKKDIKLAYNNYIKNIEASIKSDSNKFWQYVRDKRLDKSRSLVMEYNGVNLDNGAAIAEAFKEYFSSVYVNYTVVPVAEEATAGPSMLGVDCFNIKQITEYEVCLAIKNLKSKSTSGPDFLPQYLFKGCSDILIKPLTFLYNLCLKTCTFPEKWKTTKITPIFKSGKQSQIINHRPVAVLSVPAKIFEMVINKYLIHHILTHISDIQHGFLPKRSVNTNLLNFTSFVSSGLDSGVQTDSIFLDLAKAFDRVDHLILLKKLHYYGLSNSLIKLFTSYLINRKQYVYFNGHISSVFNVESGVPQGSNLGPTLFLIMINDIGNYITSSKALLFADDLKLFNNILSGVDCQHLQNDINNVVRWSIENKMSFNTSKCYVMTFSRTSNVFEFNYKINGNLISRVNKIKDLGVYFDSSLSFNYHIDHCISSATKIMGLIFRLGVTFQNVDTLKTLFRSLVRSRLECSAVIWNTINITQEDALERVQKKFLRFLYYKSFNIYTYLVPYSELLEMFGFESLSRRRGLQELLFLYKLVHGMVYDPISLASICFRVPIFHSRSKLLFSLPYSRTLAHAGSPLFRMMRLYNVIATEVSEPDIFFVNLKVFKSQCAKFLIRVNNH